MQLQERFEEYYNQYRDMVYSLCLGYSKGNHDLTDDLLQETFLNLWNALPRFEGRSSPKTWIYRICVNTCLVHIRKNKKRVSEPLVVDHAVAVDEPNDEDKYKELYVAIGQLKELDRIIIMLVLEELPYLEIAEITGLTEGNLRVKVLRIKNRLNKLLNNGR